MFVAGPFLTKVEQQQRWERIRGKPGNEQCAECASPAVSWVVLEYGILICIRCAGAHRALGTHISKVCSHYRASVSLLPRVTYHL